MLNDSKSIITPVVPQGRVITLRKLGRGLLLAAIISGITACAHGQRTGSPVSSLITTQPPALTIEKDIDLVRLEGIFGSDEEIETVYERASAIFGHGMLINDLRQSDSVVAAGWLESLLDAADAIAIADVEDFSLVVVNGELTVGGQVESEGTAMVIADVARRTTDQQLVVNNALKYPTEELDEEPFQLARIETDSGQVDQQAQVVEAKAVRKTLALEPALEPVPALVDGNPAVEQSVSAIILEQQAIAEGLSPSIPAMTALAEVQESRVVSLEPDLAAATVANRSALFDIEDGDGDGIADGHDDCVSRSGYPVNHRGCQVLDGHLKNVRFQGKTDQLTDRAMASLDSLASVMGAHPVSRIAVLSYTSDSGSDWDMRGQARDRARAVVSYLVDKGVAKDRLQAYAFGYKNGSGDDILIKEID